MREAYPEVTADAFRDSITGYHAFVAAMTDDDVNPGSAVETATSSSPATPAAVSPGVPAGTPTLTDPIAPEPGRATDGDALLAMARAALDSQRIEHPEIARRNRSQLVAQVDPLSGWARLHDGELLPPTSLTAVMQTMPGRVGILCLRPLAAADLTAHNLGRTTRDVSLPLRELLGSLDGARCRFPACTRHKKLHAHHVLYWSDDGPTDLANLVNPEYDLRRGATRAASRCALQRPPARRSAERPNSTR